MIRKRNRKMPAFCMAAVLLLSVYQPAEAYGGNISVSDSGQPDITQYMDCFLPMPVIGELNEDCWGAADTGARDQKNGLEDPDMSDYCYWDGSIIKDEETGKYYMFASRWAQNGGHWGSEYDGYLGWRGSQAIRAVSDNLYGPYVDEGLLWPDYYDGSGHNVFALKLSEEDPLYGQYKYAISVSDVGRNGDDVNGTIHLSDSLTGEWTHAGKMNVDTQKFGLSNISIMVRPDGRYEATNRNGDLAISDSITGPWEVVEQKLWWKVPGMSSENIEDPVIWYSDGLYHCVVNKWDARHAYYLTSADGIHNWKLHQGTAYTPDVPFLSYDDGTMNQWTKLERPNVYIEDGTLKAMTFAVIDVQKEEDLPNDTHGSKVIVVPFAGEKLGEFASQKDLLELREGILPIADSNTQSWQEEAWKNYGNEPYIQLQRNTQQGIFGEGKQGERPNEEYDCKIGYLKYDLSGFDLKETGEDIDSAYLSLVYLEKKAGDISTDRIRVSLSDADWIEGIGREETNGNQTEEGTLTWWNQPNAIYNLNDAEHTTALSSDFSLEEKEQEVRIDVTELLRCFKQGERESDIISFALSEMTGAGRIRIGSKEAGEKYAAKLSVYKKSEKEITSVETVQTDTVVGEEPVLPASVTVTYSDGTTGAADVKWEIHEKDVSAAGKVNVSGKIPGYAKKASAIVNVRCAVSAGDLEWTEETTGAPARNRSKGGNELKARTGRLTLPVSYEKGIGTLADSEVVYDIKGKGYESFQADISLGYDYGQTAPGAVVFKVYVDEKEEPEYTSPVMTKDTGFIRIDVDVRDAEKVRLVTEAALLEDKAPAEYQVADWCGARFVSGSIQAEKSLWDAYPFLYTECNTLPELPETTTVEIAKGQTAECRIEWQNLTKEEFLEPGVVKIEGKVAGTKNLTVTMTVMTDFDRAMQMPDSKNKIGLYQVSEDFSYVPSADEKIKLTDIGDIDRNASLLYGWSENLLIENCTAHGYGFGYGVYPDPNRENPEYLIVRAPDIHGFSIRGTAYDESAAEQNFSFETSADGKTWKSLTEYEKKADDASEGEWPGRIYQADNLLEQTNYIKILFPAGETWKFNLNRIEVTGGTKAEENKPDLTPEPDEPDSETGSDPGAPEAPGIGTTFTDGNLIYKVTAAGTVSVSGLANAKAKKIVVPASVKSGSCSFKVTAIEKGVFQKKNITSLDLGENVDSIGAKSFFQCKKLKTVRFRGTKAPKVGSKAFSKIKANCKITVPKKISKKELKKLKKAMKSAGKKVKYIKKK